MKDNHNDAFVEGMRGEMEHIIAEKMQIEMEDFIETQLWKQFKSGEIFYLNYAVWCIHNNIRPRPYYCED